MNDIVFSICITSYNRVKELNRLLQSVDSKRFEQKLEIIVSEDKSPKQEDIRDVVLRFSQQSVYKVIYNTNEVNLGYDRNLGRLKELASGIYILYMSDDDCFLPNTLDDYFDFILKNDCASCFQPFVTTKGIERKYSGHHYYEASEITAGRHVYDSILFSGLTFKKECINGIPSEPFLNSYYFQVYMFMTVAYKYGLYYYDVPLVDCVSDGENAYGLSESSIKNNDLANRKSAFSNLEFNKGLLWVIGHFDEVNGTNCKAIFGKEYSLRSLGGMIRARKEGYSTYREYIKRLESLNIKLVQPYKVYKLSIALFGPRCTEFIFNLPKRVLLSIRKKS